MRSFCPVLLLAAIAASPPARAAELFGANAYYVGDLHAHTGFSGDAGSSDIPGTCGTSCGAFAEVFDTARANGLDFLAITDHLNSNPALTHDQWRTLLGRMRAANDPEGGFVTIPGGELWFTLAGTGDRLGHKTLLLFGDDATLADATLDDVRFTAGSTVTTCDDIWTFMAELDAGFGSAMLVPHHPAVRAPMHTDWACHSPEWEPAVEVYSEHGNSLHDDGYDTPGAGIYPEYTARAALDPEGYGLVFGFVAGTDSHDTRPGAVCNLDPERPTHLYGGGLTVAVLRAGDTFDRAAIGTAIRERRTYVTTGPALPVEVVWRAADVRLGGLGEALNAPATLPLDVEVRVPLDRSGFVTAVDLVGPDTTWPLVDDGAGTWTGAVPVGETPPWLYVAVAIDGADWYGAEGGCPDGGDAVEWIWTSPSPIALAEDDIDGDGWSSWLDDCDDTDPDVHPEAEETWYDGVDADCAGDDDYDQDGDGVRGGGEDDDCDDTDPDVRPGAEDAWYDGVDADCRGNDDFDRDLDGWPGGAEGLPDCDDGDPARSPDAAERWYDGVDQDCDGRSDYDQDGDGYDSAAWGGTDCADADAAIAPGAAEVWYDGVDQDCDPATEYDADADGVRFPADCHDDDPRRAACDAVSPTHRGCISGPAPATLGLALAALALAARRARPTRS